MVSPTGPARVLDMHALTRGCGEACTHDGIHYNDAAYDAVLQQLLQVLGRECQHMSATAPPPVG
jgi:hypothetical protein